MNNKNMEETGHTPYMEYLATEVPVPIEEK
jgi:hypothetical protein